MWFIRALVILVGVIAVLWLGMLNAGESVDFHFYTREFYDLNLNLLMLLVFVSGMVFSFFVAMLNELELRTHLRRSRKSVAKLEREVSALRNLPLEDADVDSDSR